MSSAEWIAKRRELLADATKGPWELRSYMDREYSVYAPRWPGIVAELGIGAEDTALIADARTSLPRALDALEAVLDLAREWEDSSDLLHPSLRPHTRSGRIRAAIESALRAES